MKKQIFSLGVYRESMRRMLRAGCILGVILLLGAVLFPITEQVMRNGQQIIGGELSTLGLPFMTFVPSVGAPVLAWIAFSFLRRRSTSDFFHALPQTRLCLYLSVSAALLTWLFLLTVLPIAAGYITGCLLPGVSLSAFAMLRLAACVLIAGIQVGAVIIFAQSITGTFFSSLIVGGMTLFAPRILMYSALQMLDSTLRVSAFGEIAFLSPEFNLGLMAYVQTFISSLSLLLGGVEYSPSSAAPYLYSAGLAAVFLVLGGVCFCRRRSETAEHSAPNKKVQSLLRVLVFCAISLPITPILFGAVYRRPNFEQAWAYLILYAGAAVAYFAYELITTKRFRNLLRALPGFAIGIALNAVLLGTLYGVSEKVLSFTPAGGEIKSVMLLSGIDAEGFDDYVIAKTGSLEITDTAVCDLIAKKLCNEVEAVKKGSEREELYFAGNPDFSGAHTYSVLLKTENGKYRRRVTVSLQTEKDKITAAYEKDGRFVDAYLNLPLTDETEELRLCFAGEEYTDPVVKEVYETLREEVKTLSLSEWDRLRSESDGSEVVQCYTWLRGSRYALQFPVSAKKTPRAFAKFAEIVYKHTESIGEAFLSSVQKGDSDNEKSVYEVRFFVPEAGEEFLWEVNVGESQGNTVARDIFDADLSQLPFLKEPEHRAPQEGEGYVRLSFSGGGFGQNGEDFGTATLIFALPNLTMQTVQSWTEQAAQSIGLSQAEGRKD